MGHTGWNHPHPNQSGAFSIEGLIRIRVSPAGCRTSGNTAYKRDLALANPACPIHLIGYTAKTVRIRTKGQG